MKPKKLLSFLPATAMTISLLPTFAMTASATPTTEKNITLKTAALSGYDSTNGYDYIYYGTYNSNPIKWRVLTMNGNNGTYEDGDGNDVTSQNAMFLLSEYALKQMVYENAFVEDYDGQTYPSDWRYSDAWFWCNDTTDTNSFIYDSFTGNEKKYLLKTNKANDCDNPYTNELKGDTFFFLSKSELESDYMRGNETAKLLSDSDDPVEWWLRAPNGYYTYSLWGVNATKALLLTEIHSEMILRLVRLLTWIPQKSSLHLPPEAANHQPPSRAAKPRF